MGEDLYPIKVVPYGQRAVPIITQNDNGPCPFIAICNILLLRGDILLPAGLQAVRFGQLLNLVSSFMLERQKSRGLESDANAQYQVDDVLRHLPGLQFGMDVNVRFKSVMDYEFCPAMVCFDAFQIRMVHGWVLSPDAAEDVRVVGPRSYNGLTDLIIAKNDILDRRRARAAAAAPPASAPPQPAEGGGQHSPQGMSESSELRAALALSVEVAGEATPEPSASPGPSGASPPSPPPEPSAPPPPPPAAATAPPAAAGGSPSPPSPTPEQQAEEERIIRDAAAAEHFLQSTAGQLTYTGLFELTSNVKEGELCVLFRNNHFSTLTKQHGQLYCLLTDVGYRDMPGAVWERLVTIDGDMQVVDGAFRVPRDLGRQERVMAAIDRKQAEGREPKPPAPAAAEGAALQRQTDSDLAMALHLQQEEERAAEEERRALRLRQQREDQLRREQLARQQQPQGRRPQSVPHPHAAYTGAPPRRTAPATQPQPGRGAPQQQRKGGKKSESCTVL
eukprot:TRINITY_DN14571_c0_g4_i1.p1 TRINITY_DN14571_c0_g4~~TRINITY_DN14571_c0_g4_i1.p1  ORF type:complete len:505 (+),score=157.77 TRINITY_DN14571_c0_g4_i1:107-1621(+)